MEEAEMDSLVQQVTTLANIISDEGMNTMHSQNNNADEKNVDFVLVWEDNPSDPQWSNHT